MPKMIFVNLPVKDLAAATRFYQAIGCQKNEQFSTAQASCMVWSETITFMLLTHEYFSTYTTKPISDARKWVGALFALSRDSRAEVDSITEAAGSSGGKADVRDRQDMGFMYVRTFADPDGHVFEPMWMDMAAAAGATQEQAKSA
jgi:predicted lactoylglutathione lyase